MQRLHDREGGRATRRFERMGGLEVIEFPRGSDVAALARRYRSSGLVESAEADQWLRPLGAGVDPAFLDGTQWHLKNSGQGGGVVGADIHAEEAWRTLSDAGEVVLALIDTGIAINHDDLHANLWTNPGEIPGNGIDDDLNGIVDDVHGMGAPDDSGDIADRVGHGTMVAGVAGAVGGNGLGGSGVAPHIRLMMLRFVNDQGLGSVADVVQCFDYARAQGAKVINASIATTNFSVALFTAVSACRSAGIIVVCGAGNDAFDTDLTPIYPAGLSLDNVVSVLATSRFDTLWPFSNFGVSSVDLGAPGVEIYTTSSFAASSYTQVSGTSFSTPVVSAGVALLRARFPMEDSRQILSRLLNSVDRVPALEGRCATGGRMNLARALGPGLAADFSAVPVSGLLPLTVQFSNSSFGKVTSTRWDFGDGGSSEQAHPSHLFQVPGSLKVTLTVGGDDGTENRVSKRMTVLPPYTVAPGTFAWVDASRLSPLALSGDAFSAALPIPFLFHFYGLRENVLHVGANGLVGFETNGLNSAANTALPAGASPNGILCPYWDDLSPVSGSVFTGVIGVAPTRRAVVSWVDVAPSGGGFAAPLSFQIHLEEATDRIYFQYSEVQPANRNPRAGGKSATVGIESREGLLAAQYSWNGGAPLSNSQCLVFIPPATRAIAVSPDSVWQPSGVVGALPTGEGAVYELVNVSDAPLDWAGVCGTSWVVVSPSNGTLPPGGSTFVTLRLAERIPELPGKRETEVSFLNLSTGVGNATRKVVWTVLAPANPEVRLDAGSTSESLILSCASVEGWAFSLLTSSDLHAWQTDSTASRMSGDRVVFHTSPGPLGSPRFFRIYAAPASTVSVP